MGLSTKILPGNATPNPFSGHQTLHFTDRQPICFEPSTPSDPRLLRPVFVYCDAYERSLNAFKTHLRRYVIYSTAWAIFRFVYASPHLKKLPRGRGNVRHVHAVSRAGRPLGIDSLFPGPMVVGQTRNGPNSHAKIATGFALGRRTSLGSRSYQPLQNGARIWWGIPNWRTCQGLFDDPELQLGDLSLARAVRLFWIRKATFGAGIYPQNCDQSGTIVPNAGSTSRLHF